MGSDPYGDRPLAKSCRVSIHAPAWGATPRCTAGTSRRRCFNPRSRMGSDGLILERPVHRDMVSIHAPAWGATRRRPRHPQTDRVSIHAPAWGATQRSRPKPLIFHGFNPRSRMGSDIGCHRTIIGLSWFQSTLPHGERRDRRRVAAAVLEVSIHDPAWGATRRAWRVASFPAVSIHAPAWGATGRSYVVAGFERQVSIHAPAWGATDSGDTWGDNSSGFNPRSRMGSDVIAPNPLTGGIGFNPRSRMGSDPATAGSRPHPRSFNPRSRMGSDHQHPDAPNGEPVSIHAPAWGATTTDNAVPIKVYVSIHAPAWGATIPPNPLLPLARGFNPRSRMGSDTLHARAGSVRAGFNPRSRMGSDDADGWHLEYRERVSIHAPAWGATGPRGRNRDRAGVSIHAPAWGATIIPLMHATAKVLFQSTLPHGERLEAIGQPVGLAIEVSIHAPAWGATDFGIGSRLQRVVSIHAPAWGATRGVDRVRTDVAVSIHAPAWGATGLRAKSPRPGRGFNPRSRMGSDLTSKSRRSCKSGFNPRSRMGSDHAAPRRSFSCCCFNPRSRMGSDIVDPGNHFIFIAFQSTLPHGERQLGGDHVADGLRFQSTLPHGERRTTVTQITGGATFQSTLPHGERPAEYSSVVGHTHEFQSTLPHGERPLTMQYLPSAPEVSIHAPAWGAT